MLTKGVQVSVFDWPSWGSEGGATLRDLGEDDKKKVARLIHQVFFSEAHADVMALHTFCIQHVPFKNKRIRSEIMPMYHARK